MDSEQTDWFTLTILAYADDERKREKGRRALLDLVTRHPGLAARTPFGAVAESAREHRRYLWSRFGYDVKRNRWRRGRPLPESERDWCLLWHSRQMWNKQIALIGAWILGGSEALSNGTDPATGAVRRFVHADRMLVWPDGCDSVLCPWPLLQREAFARFTGTLLARINLKRNLRLRSVLAPGSLRDQRLELAQRLPAVVWRALKDGGR